MGSSFGVLFRITTFGESHGPGLGVVIDGCPAQLALDVEAIQRELDRRRPGQSRLVTQRKEDDKVEILDAYRWHSSSAVQRVTAPMVLVRAPSADPSLRVVVSGSRRILSRLGTPLTPRQEGDDEQRDRP